MEQRNDSDSLVYPKSNGLNYSLIHDSSKNSILLNFNIQCDKLIWNLKNIYPSYLILVQVELPSEVSNVFKYVGCPHFYKQEVCIFFNNHHRIVYLSCIASLWDIDDGKFTGISIIHSS